MNAAFFMLGLLVGNIIGFLYRENYAIDDWREGYEDCQRAWDDWERAAGRKATTDNSTVNP